MGTVEDANKINNDSNDYGGDDLYEVSSSVEVSSENQREDNAQVNESRN